MLISIYSFLILIMYFLAGIHKIKNFSETVKGFKGMFYFKNLPNIFYTLSILGVIILEIIAPIAIMVSLKTNMYQHIAYYSSISLVIFTILATLIYHFPPSGSQYIPFMKNLTAVGGLLLLSTQFN